MILLCPNYIYKAWFFNQKKKIDSSLPKIISTKFCQSHGSTEKGHSHENKILKRTDRQMAVHV